MEQGENSPKALEQGSRERKCALKKHICTLLAALLASSGGIAFASDPPTQPPPQVDGAAEEQQQPQAEPIGSAEPAPSSSLSDLLSQETSTTPPPSAAERESPQAVYSSQGTLYGSVYEGRFMCSVPVHALRALKQAGEGSYLHAEFPLADGSKLWMEVPQTMVRDRQLGDSAHLPAEILLSDIDISSAQASASEYEGRWSISDIKKSPFKCGEKRVCFWTPQCMKLSGPPIEVRPSRSSLWTTVDMSLLSRGGCCEFNKVHPLALQGGGSSFTRSYSHPGFGVSTAVVVQAPRPPDPPKPCGGW